MKKKIREVIVVEGRYDKNTLSQVVDAVIVETGGFSVFHNKEKIDYLRRLARERGLILMTDPDGAGFVIRNYLKGSIPPEQIKQAYVPDIRGKERRKQRPGKEGKLGVEGMRPEVLLEALRRAGATFEGDAPQAARTGEESPRGSVRPRPDRPGLGGKARGAAEDAAPAGAPEHRRAGADAEPSDEPGGV